jgi:hypothetical protein
MAIALDEIIEWIEWEANHYDCEKIKSAIHHSTSPKIDAKLFVHDLEGTYHQSEKIDLLSRAFAKYSLDELEKKLGTKWDLI